ncbi:hypothetical protein AB0A70_19870 [Streptomyces morookaense]|uniref:hypothetical protein n=1 Tax=Streptomyces morookaense TaxID=1970 RepID=UPI00340C7121
MLKHASAPAGRYTQVPNEIIRHPRLGEAAIRLALWLLSLPEGADVSLSEAARRAGLTPSAFQKAKRQLREEGYFHEWRMQGRDGRWRTRQLISNVPLTPEEALAVRDGAAPTAVKPAVGEPGGRRVGRHQEKTGEKTDLPPSQPSEPEPHPLAERGAQALASISHRERKLRLTGREVTQLAPLAAEWLLRGATMTDLREALTNGLPEPVHCPAALVRDRLVRKMPDAPAMPQQRAAAGPPLPPPRVSMMVECRGEHIQPRLFRPVGDEVLCGDCCRAHTQAVHAETTARGAAAARARLRGAA